MAKPSKASSVATRRQKCFLVCNAHLDPVWLWQWEEGLTEAISTYRVAADFCERYPDFVFNHNESLLYEWVERNDPPLFARIRRLVKQGRWHIAGGSFLQPDMIGASGESLIRQFLVGKTYFREKFDREPTTAYNFDSFGHPQGLIQILAGCGFDSYVFCRPNRGALPLPVGSFRWQHASGVEIIGRRSDEHYITQGHLLLKMTDTDWANFFRDEGDFMFLWGIGNHGGGPSHAEYADLKKLPKLFPHLEFIESTPEDFFRHTLAVRGRDSLPVVTGDFKPVSEGCYTSVATIKRRHRRVENLLHLVEKLAAVAWWRDKQDYPTDDLAVAWKDLLFSEFHDILPGSCIPSAEADSINLLGHAEEILRRRRASSFISLLRDEPLAERNETPIFVFNPHSWEVTQDIEIEYGIDRQFSPDSVVRSLTLDGQPVTAQFEKSEENLINKDWGEWRARAVFPLTIPPLSYKRLQTHYEVLPPNQIRRWRTPALPQDTSHLKLTAEGGLTTSLNLTTGLLDEVRCGNRVVIGSDSFVPLVFDDLNHSWATVTQWDQPLGRFTLATPERAGEIAGSSHTRKNLPGGKTPLTIIEDGPVRTVVEAIFTYGASYLVQRYSFHKLRPLIHLDQTVFWAEHDKKLRLELAPDLALTRVEAEKCYSIDNETDAINNGKEHDFQHFLHLTGEKGASAMAVISHGTHAYASRLGVLRLNLLRSPSYATHEENVAVDYDRYHDRYMPRQEQGIRHSRFTLLFGELAAGRDQVARAAYEHNVPPEPFVYFPTNRRAKAKKPRSFATVQPANVLLTVVKKAETGNDLVLRLWETAGRDTKGTLTVEGKKYPFAIGASRLQTLRLTAAGKIVETDLLERKTTKK